MTGIIERQPEQRLLMGLSVADVGRLLDALPSPALVASPMLGEQAHANEAFCQLAGLCGPVLPRSGIRFGEGGMRLAPDEDPIGLALAGTVTRGAKMQFQHKDGPLRSVLVHAKPWRGDDGGVDGAVVLMQDLQEPIEAAHAFRELTTYTPALLFTADANGRIDSINARWTGFIGEAADELLGSGWTRFIHPDDLAHVLTDWSNNVASGEPYQGQWRFLRGDGTYRWTEIRAEARRDDEGRILRWFGSGTDVDAQRRALEALDFLAETGAATAAEEDVARLLDRLAEAALEGLADISIFDLREEGGNVARMIVASPRAKRSAVEVTKAFEAPHSDERHPIARALYDGQTIHIPNVDEAFIRANISPEARREAWRFIDIRSIVCAPMTTSGRSIGALTLVRTGASVPFDTSDMRVVEEVARRAAIAVENVRLKERERREARNLQAYADIGEALGGSLGLRDTLDQAMAVIVPERADWAFVNLVDDRGDLRLAGVYHRDAEKGRELSSHVGSLYARGDVRDGSPAVARTRVPLFLETIDYEASRHIVSPDILATFSKMELASVIVVPLLSSSDVRGTLHLCVDGRGSRFTAADVEFFAELARRMAPAIANAELFERERRVARSFQDAALPASLPDVKEFAFHAIYETGKSEALVGGDWYDAFVLADGRIVVSIGDVAGSGLSAAVAMSGVRQAIRGAAHVDADPGVMLEAANQAVLADADHRFVTAFVGVIECGSRPIIRYQSAGHPSPLLLTADGSLRELGGHGPPLGLKAIRRKTSDECALPPGSLLALYTDGLTEATHDLLEGEAKLRSALIHPSVNRSGDPAKSLHDAVLVDGSRDDVAILTIRTIGLVKE